LARPNYDILEIQIHHILGIIGQESFIWHILLQQDVSGDGFDVDLILKGG